MKIGDTLTRPYPYPWGKGKAVVWFRLMKVDVWLSRHPPPSHMACLRRSWGLIIAIIVNNNRKIITSIITLTASILTFCRQTFNICFWIYTLIYITLKQIYATCFRYQPSWNWLYDAMTTDSWLCLPLDSHWWIVDCRSRSVTEWKRFKLIKF